MQSLARSSLCCCPSGWRALFDEGSMDERDSLGKKAPAGRWPSALGFIQIVCCVMNKEEEELMETLADNQKKQTGRI